MKLNRATVLDGIPVLDITEEASDLADLFVTRNLNPAKVLIDALHVSIATIHGMDFVLTWNCRHIANAEISRRRERGYRMPPFACPRH